jgi:hydrogenase expression/formation protein HypE
MELNCPLPVMDTECILLGHGSGGRLSHKLITDVFYPAFRNPILEQEHDGGVFTVDKKRLAITTDSYVVDPVFFPGGNIGDLAVNGTVNDLACCGAKPLYLTAGFILEEGFFISDLKAIVDSMRIAAEKAGVFIVTGDTKVVERGKCDKIFINTSGVGVLEDGINISPKRACAGDVIICSGPIGVHGITILSTRESLGFETALKSDTASLNGMLNELCAQIKDIHVLRDPTRGGVSSTLNEIAQSSNTEIEIDETLLPIPDVVRSASEMLGLDPLYIANEGVALVMLPASFAKEALQVMRQFPEGEKAVIIGAVTAREGASVKMKTLYGGHRVMTMLSGDQLPRIC